MQFQHLAREHGLSASHQFANVERRLELLERLNALPGSTIPQDAITKRPTIALSVLVPIQVRNQFLAVLAWLVAELRTEGDRSG